VLGEPLIVYGDGKHHFSRHRLAHLPRHVASLFGSLAPMFGIDADGAEQFHEAPLGFASANACRPFSLIRNVATSIVSRPARMRVGVALARPERTKLANCMKEKP
jgi:hypothetical protein